LVVVAWELINITETVIMVLVLRFLAQLDTEGVVVVPEMAMGQMALLAVVLLLKMMACILEEQQVRDIMVLM
jgi:hypothetical protein